MQYINIKKLLSYSKDSSNLYNKPTYTELLEYCLKVSDLLMIDKQGKLQVLEEEIKSLKQKYKRYMNLFHEKVEKRIQELFQKIDVQKLK